MNSRQFPSARRHQSGRIASGLVFAGFALIASYFLVTEHRAHLAGWWPLLFLAACVLLHLSHGGHGHGGHRHEQRSLAEHDPKESSADQHY